MTAWKDLERRVARALGGERSGPLGRHGSDARGTRFAVECKRTTRYQIRQAWIQQARRQSKVEGVPWLLVVSEHGDRRPVVVLDFWQFTEIAQAAGLIPAPLPIVASLEQADEELRQGVSRSLREVLADEGAA